MFKLKEKFDIKKVFKGEKLSLFYAAVFVLSVLLALIFNSVYYTSNIKEGEISLRSIYAPYDFKYPWGINEEKTNLTREDFVKSIPAVFDIDNFREEEAVKNLNDFIDSAASLKDAQIAKSKEERIELARKAGNVAVRDSTVLYFSELKDRARIKPKLIDVLTSIYPLGIMRQDEKNDLLKENKPAKIRNLKSKTEKTRPIKDALSQEDAGKISREYLEHAFPQDTKLREYSYELISALLRPNLNFNKPETDRLKEDALKIMPQVYDFLEVKKNELILGRGERITKKHIAQLTELGAIGSITQKGPYLAGISFLLIILILISVPYLIITDKALVNSPKNIGIILLNALIIIVISQFIIQSPQPDYLIPLSGTVMLISILVSAKASILVSIILSIFMGVISGGKIELAIVLLAGGFVGGFIVRDARRRSKIIIAGLLSGAAEFAAVISMGLLNNFEYHLIFNDGLWAFTGGIISIFLVMSLLPLFEYIFKITTNITLLELSDLNHPLLKELTLKAPGTYQHSVVVGNLAEAACDAIGANSLLARVGSYYHDIGKIEKAEYFSENEMGAHSKHEKLTPSMSALIIINHVKDGVDLAKKYNINTRIIDFISQHHGSGLIYYFYQRALEKVKDEEVLKEEEFRYPGPKPQTKEAAVVLLADSVEASSRALSDPTPARIMGLAQKIINNKFIDSQLDECDLTLKDLDKIASSFVRILTAIFHTRLEYPDKKANGAKKTDVKIKSRKSK